MSRVRALLKLNWVHLHSDRQSQGFREHADGENVMVLSMSRKKSRTPKQIYKAVSILKKEHV